MMRALLMLTLLVLPACRSTPIRTVMQGNMTMDGAMSMVGDMKMAGDMTMSGDVATSVKADNTASRLAEIPVYTSSIEGSRKIAVIDVDGLLVNKPSSGFGSMGENPVALFREKLDWIAADPRVAAIVLRINSPGGGVTAADMMAQDLERLKRARQIPVIACLMDSGAGAGYYLASSADRIVAHPTSVVGGIGVILNLYRLEDSLAQFNIIPVTVKSGEHIDMATPLRQMDESEQAMFNSMASEFHERFIAKVHGSRRVPTDSEVFDGRVVSGTSAQALGLVDQTGYLDDALDVARGMATLPSDASVVMLRRDNDRAYTLLDVTPNTPTSLLPINIPGFDRSKLPMFLYMWQPDPGLAART